VLEALLEVIKIRVGHDLDFAHEMAMMDLVMVVVINHPAIVFVLQMMINIRQIVVSDFAARIDAGVGHPSKRICVLKKQKAQPMRAGLFDLVPTAGFELAT